MTAVPRWTFAFAGFVAGAAGIATSVASAWALRTATNPVLAVASTVRDNTPGSLAPKLIHLVGHADKPLLVIGTIVILLALCAWGGVLTRRHPLWADLLFLLLAALGLAAVAGQPHAGTSDGLTVVVGFLTWVVVLRVLTGLLRRDQDLAAVDVAPSRRGFLMASGGVVVVSGLALFGGRLASRGRRAVEAARRLLRLPIGAGKVPDAATLDVPGIAPWRTPNSDFYLIHTALVVPSVPPSQWQLRVHGMVDTELTFSYQDLVARQFTQAWVTLCCVSNEVGGDLIGNAYWSGVLIREILAEAGVQAGADAIKQTSYDGWTCGTPLGAVTDDRMAMLAVGMNGEPLPIEHGFPVRMVVPGLYGYVSATKWLVDIEVTRFDKFRAYWTDEGWSPLGPVKTQSRIDVPRNGRRVAAGAVRVGGSAWAQHTGIEKVEFQLDGGAWSEATLGGVPNLDTWVQWSGEVQADPGRHQLRVRATNRSGYTQTAVRTDVVPNGATGWDGVSFTAT